MDFEILMATIAGVVTIIAGVVGTKYSGLRTKYNEIKDLVMFVDKAMEDGTIDADEMKLIWGQLKSIF